MKPRPKGNTYVFTMVDSNRGPEVDWFVDITPLDGQTIETFKQTCEIMRKLGVDEDEVRQVEDLPLIVQIMISLRSRFTTGGRVFKLTMDEGTITDAELTKIMRIKSAQGTLSEFLDGLAI